LDNPKNTIGPGIKNEFASTHHEYMEYKLNVLTASVYDSFGIYKKATN